MKTLALVISICLACLWANPGLLPWVGVLGGLLAGTPPKRLQDIGKNLLAAAITLILLQKIQTFHHGISHEFPIKPVHLLMAAWALQALKNKINPIDGLKNPGTWLLALFTCATILLEHIHLKPWQWNPTQRNLEAMVLGLMLASTQTKKATVLWTLTYLCLATLTLSKIPLPIEIGSGPITPKNPGCALSALCVGFLLAHNSRKSWMAAGLLSCLILIHQSIGALAICGALWVIHLTPTCLQKFPLKQHWFPYTSTALLSLLLLLWSPTLLNLMGKNTGASGRIPAAWHLTANWGPQSPTWGLGEGFRQTYGIPDGPNQHKLRSTGPMVESLYLQNFVSNATPNNALAEALVHYGLPTWSLFLLSIATLCFASPFPKKSKLGVLVATLTTLSYLGIGPFSWRELGLIWLIPHLLSQTPTTLTEKIPPPRHLPLYTLILSTLTITIALLNNYTNKAWSELWVTPLHVTLVPLNHPTSPNNRGALLPAQTIQETAKKEKLSATVLRPYLSNNLLIYTQTPTEAEQARKILEEKTGIPSLALQGNPNPIQTANLLLIFTPPLLSLLAFISLKTPKTILAGSLFTLLPLLALTLPKTPQTWRQETLLIQTPTITKEYWKDFWKKEIHKTAFGEILTYKLKQQGHLAEFRYPKKSWKTYSGKTPKIKSTPNKLHILTTASSTEIQKAAEETKKTLNKLTVDNPPTKKEKTPNNEHR